MLLLAVGTHGSAETRTDELKRVVNRNTGFAHMTRGVNMYTLIALRSCVAAGDIPVLSQMLFDEDYVMQLAAAGVLVDLGAPGRAALAQAASQATEARTKMLLQDSLQEADAPGRKPLADYPLTERERRSIKGCAPAR